MNQFTLSVKNISCQRDENLLFENLDFEIKSGQCVLIEGRNGAGKTTLLHILSGLRTPDEGDVFFCDQQINSFDSEFFSNVSYLGHHNGLKMDLTARENLEMSIALGRANGQSIDSALEYLRLKGYEDEPVKKFSAGMKRRTALARLLVMNAPLWILDEPYTSLDVYGIKKMEESIEKHVQSGGSVIMTSHHEVKLNDVELVRLNLTELKCQ